MSFLLVFFGPQIAAAVLLVGGNALRGRPVSRIFIAAGMVAAAVSVITAGLLPFLSIALADD